MLAPTRWCLVAFALVSACGTDSTQHTIADVVADAADTFTPPDTVAPADTTDTAAPEDTADTADTAPDTIAPADTTDTAEPDTAAPEDTADTAPDTTIAADTADTTEPDTADTADTAPADTADAAPSDTFVDSPPGALAYERIDNVVMVDDLTRVVWHASGDYALIAGVSGKLAIWKPPSTALRFLGTVGSDITDLLAFPDGHFAVLDATLGLVEITIDADDATLTIGATTALPVGSGRALSAEPGSDRVAIAAASPTNDTIDYLYLWSPSAGLSPVKGFNAAAGISDVMWGAPSLYAGSPNLVTAHGRNGADSKTWVLASDVVVDNGWSPGFGNAGRSRWRPDGLYGLVCGWSSNKLYVFDGAWTMATLPVPNGASPNAVAWKADGTRALVVGRVIGSPPYAVVVEQRAGSTSAWQADFIDQSIHGFDQPPWLGNSSTMHLLDVAWRPGTPCDEGIIVGTDSGASLSPTFGTAIHFQDTADPTCAAKDP